MNKAEEAIWYQQNSNAYYANARDFAARGPSKRSVARMFQRQAAYNAKKARILMGVEQ